jgi:hypothetical protein
MYKIKKLKKLPSSKGLWIHRERERERDREIQRERERWSSFVESVGLVTVNFSGV